MALSDLEVGDEEIEVARWLEESGRRRVTKEWLKKVDLKRGAPESEPERGVSRPLLTRPSWLCLFALTATSFLIYFFAGVQLQIESMRSVVVFVSG